MTFEASGYTVRWIHLLVETAMDYIKSPILFILAMKTILKATENISEPPRFRNDCQMPPLQALMADTTVITSSDMKKKARYWNDWTTLSITLFSISYEPRKSRSLLLIKGKMTNYTVTNQISIFGEKQMNSYSTMYDVSVKDMNAVKQIIEVKKGMELIHFNIFGHELIYVIQPNLLHSLFICDYCLASFIKSFYLSV